MPMSASVRSAVRSAPSRSSPSASSVSAAPAFELAARLPCLATGTPQAATTSATAVDTLRVWCPSPPVPQTSIALAGASMGISRARIARAAPAISAAVSPRSERSERKRAMSSSAGAPSRSAPKEASACSSVSGSATDGSALMRVRASRPRRAQGNWRAVRARARWRCFPGGTVRRGSAAPCGGSPLRRSRRGRASRSRH